MVLGDTIYLTLSSSDSGVHLSRLPQQQDLCCRGAACFLQRHRCEPLSLLMSWLFTAILMSNLGVVCCFEICPNNKDPPLATNLWCSVLLWWLQTIYLQTCWKLGQADIKRAFWRWRWRCPLFSFLAAPSSPCCLVHCQNNPKTPQLFSSQQLYNINQKILIAVYAKLYSI